MDIRRNNALQEKRPSGAAPDLVSGQAPHRAGRSAFHTALAYAASGHIRMDIRRNNALQEKRPSGAAPDLVSGQAALATSFLIGITVLFAGITMSFLTTSFLQSTYGFEAANRASAGAAAGVQDALLQLARNKDFNPGTYSIPLDSATTTVTITRNSPVAGRITILATSTIDRYEYRFRAIVSLSTSSGQVDLLSWQTQ